MRIFRTQAQRYPTLLCTENRVYLAMVDRAGKTFVRYAEKPLPPKVIVNDEIVNPDVFAQVIQSAIAEAKLPEKEIVVGVSEVKATTRSIVLPALKPDEVDQAVEQHVSSFLPFPYQDEYLDWMVIHKDEHEKEKILISAIPKSVIDGYTGVLKKIGLKPVAFESTSLSLFRLLPDEAKKSSIAVEIGEVNTLLILGFEGSIEASSVIQETAGIEDKIEKLINYYSGKRTGGTVPETVYICGKNASQQIAQQLNQRLHLKPVFLQADISNVPPQKKLELAVLSSLAKKIVDMPSDPHTINILPTPFIQEFESGRKKSEEKVYLYLQIALLVVIVMTGAYMYWMVRGQRIAVQQANASMSTAGVISADSLKIKAILLSEKHANSIRQAIDAVVLSKTEGITVKGISYVQENDEILVSGTAYSRDHLLAFQEILKKSNLFSDVIVPLSSLEDQTDVTFRIILKPS